MSRGTIDFETFVRECLQDTTYNAEEIISAVKILQKRMPQYLGKGIRVEFGDQWLTFYANFILSMTDYTDKNGETVVITPDMLKTDDGESRIGCSVNKKFKKTFNAEIEWQKISRKTGQPVEDDDATQGNENVENNEPSTLDPSTGDNGGGGSTGDGAND